MKRRKKSRWTRKIPLSLEREEEDTQKSQEEIEDVEEENHADEREPDISMEIGSSLGLTIDTSEDEDEDEHAVQPGAAPGIDRHPEIHIKPEPGEIPLRCIEYNPDFVKFTEFDHIDKYLALPRQPAKTMRWLNVDGINPYVINRLKETYNLHTLAAEDALNTYQRPKLDLYDTHLFVATRMIMIVEETLKNEHISIFITPDTLITIQEEPGDMWDPVRDRLKIANSRLRTNDTSFLLYSLIDSLVDHLFPILERYEELLEAMEAETLEVPKTANLYRVFSLKRELLMLRRILWPMREVVDILNRDEKRGLPVHIKPYLRDVLDHCSELLDLIDTYRDMAGNLSELMLNASTMRMNKVIKVLTVLATFFIPTTFLASVYGMNFQYLPELHWKYAYPAFWLICISITGGLILFFHQKGWLKGE